LGGWLFVGGLSMTIATLGVMAYFEQAGASAALVYTLGFVTFSLTHIYAVYSYRNPRLSIFNRETFDSSRVNWAVVASLAAIFLPTEVGFLQRWMGLVSLDFSGWLFCVALASITLWASELYKALVKP
jgi:Ca2+-transporting ATPase